MGKTWIYKGWHCFDQTFALREDDMFKDDARIIPVRVFINIKTEEIRLFSQKVVDEKGKEKIVEEMVGEKK